jgi:hypothetical protein
MILKYNLFSLEQFNLTSSFGFIWDICWLITLSSGCCCWDVLHTTTMSHVNSHGSQGYRPAEILDM